jgi:hypothetical protein
MERRSPLDDTSTIETLISLISAMGRARRRFIDVVGSHLDGLGLEDITPAQALLLLEIADPPASTPFRDVIVKGCHLPSNLSYMVRLLASTGYVKADVEENEEHVVRLTPQGQNLKALIADILRRSVATSMRDHEHVAETFAAAAFLERIDRSWMDFLREEAPPGGKD